MIKALLDTNEGKALLIGLSRANCEELLKGRPITFANSQFPTAGINRVIIMAGETEEAMRLELLKHFGKAEKVPGG